MCTRVAKGRCAGQPTGWRRSQQRHGCAAAARSAAPSAPAAKKAASAHQLAVRIGLLQGWVRSCVSEEHGGEGVGAGLGGQPPLAVGSRVVGRRLRLALAVDGGDVAEFGQRWAPLHEAGILVHGIHLNGGGVGGAGGRQLGDFVLLGCRVLQRGEGRRWWPGRQGTSEHGCQPAPVCAAMRPAVASLGTAGDSAVALLTVAGAHASGHAAPLRLALLAHTVPLCSRMDHLPLAVDLVAIQTRAGLLLGTTASWRTCSAPPPARSVLLPGRRAGRQRVSWARLMVGTADQNMLPTPTRAPPVPASLA